MHAPVIDVHAHFLPAGIIAAAESGADWHGTRVVRGPDGRPTFETGGVTARLSVPAYWEPPAQRLERMDAAGVDVQVVSISPVLFRYFVDAGDAVAACREVNDELARWTATWPARFRGFATLPLQAPDAAVDELARAVGDLGLCGAIVGTHVQGENWDSPALLPVLEAAEQLGAVLFVHPRDPRAREPLQRYNLRNLVGNPFETTVAVASFVLGGVLDRLPALKLVFAHAGGFAWANIGRFDQGYRERQDARERAARPPSEYLQGLYFDCLTHDVHALRYLAGRLGVGQVVLGTDYPGNMGIARPVEWLGEEAFDAAERAMILGGNAAGLLGIPTELARR